MVGLLLSRSTSLLKIADSKGQTCLHVASANGHYEMVQALLGQGSDQTMVDKVLNHTIFLLQRYFKINLEKIRSFLFSLLILGGMDVIALCSSGWIP